jgi:hypothetical protein
MIMSLRSVTGILAIVATVVVVGCATDYASTIRYANVPDFPPTNPAKVQILHTEPTRPHERLGEIAVVLQPNLAVFMAEIDEQLRREAAKLGADAAVFVVDPRYPRDLVASRMWSAGLLTKVTGRDVIAIAIKYQ